MNKENYEQISLSKEQISEIVDLLKEGNDVDVTFCKGELVGAELPNFMSLKVIKTMPGVKGNTVSGALKPATLETGAIIQVPLFIKEGDVIKIDVSPEWKDLKPEVLEKRKNVPEFVRDIADRINRLEGDQVPVSAFVGREDGSFPAGTTQYEKRGIAVNVPEWIPENCIQCNQCAYVCPQAVIRPFLLTDEELKNAPEGTKTVGGIGGVKGYHYRIQVSVLDCTGCSNCADICPSKEKALIMKPLETQDAEIERWHYMDLKVGYKENVVPKDKTVKNSQFAKPLFEFSGACPGCGETP